MPLAVDFVCNRGIAFITFTPRLECMGVYLHMRSLDSKFLFSIRHFMKAFMLILLVFPIKVQYLTNCTREYFGLFLNTGLLPFTYFKSLASIINQY